MFALTSISAFGHCAKAPNFLSPSQIDLLTEISQSPHILSDVEGALKSKQIKSDVDEYLMVTVFYLLGGS